MLSKVEQIVFDLAELDAPTQDGTYANGHDWCALCFGESDDEAKHDTGCPWRMAREYVRECAK